MKSAAKVTTLAKAVRGLTKVNEEIGYKKLVNSQRFETGLIAFRPNATADRKAINHEDKDVICYVLKGRGRLRIDGRRVSLEPGALCHIPKGTPHDFAASKTSRLILLYTIVATA